MTDDQKLIANLKAQFPFIFPLARVAPLSIYYASLASAAHQFVAVRTDTFARIRFFRSSSVTSFGAKLNPGDDEPGLQELPPNDVA